MAFHRKISLWFLRQDFCQIMCRCARRRGTTTDVFRERHATAEKVWDDAVFWQPGRRQWHPINQLDLLFPWSFCDNCPSWSCPAMFTFVSRPIFARTNTKLSLSNNRLWRWRLWPMTDCCWCDVVQYQETNASLISKNKWNDPSMEIRGRFTPSSIFFRRCAQLDEVSDKLWGMVGRTDL